MQKILSVLSISLMSLMLSNVASAAPDESSERVEMPAPPSNAPMRKGMRGDERAGFSIEQLQEHRRSLQENGKQRLKRMRWQVGYVMPQHYRGDAYKVQYKDYNLPKPTRNQQWYKINKDYLLINSEDHSIISIQDF